MSYRYAKAKRDGNERPIVDALRATFAGLVVVRHTPVMPRKDHPEDKGLDLIVGVPGCDALWMEIKDPAGRGRTRRADEEDQRAFMRAWPGPAVVVVSEAEAIAEVQSHARWRGRR